MKRIAFTSFIVMSALSSLAQSPVAAPVDSFYSLAPVEVKAVRAGSRTPFTVTNLSKSTIAANNLGQDIPFILNQTPSIVVNADGGNGVGYTAMRIRGSDATRINVTLNGIPYNDAEGQGTFFVDLPDFSSSVNSIQVQRGVGTSSNGSGAFGASVNFSTNEIIRDAYAASNNSVGSFNTWKNTIKAGTGLIDGHFTADVRLSRISSDGYIDRASSNLRSFYFSTAYINDNTTLRFNVLSGIEKTYQAWNGVPEDLLSTDRTYNSSGTEKPGTPYANETDNYQQDHYQFFFTQRLKKHLLFNTALFLSKGAGYYEEYKADQAYADYGLPNPIYGGHDTASTDLIRQLWLSNNYYGAIYSLQYNYDKTQATLGGSVTRYDGEHDGQLNWAANGGLRDNNYRWYDFHPRKKDLNLYGKWQQDLSQRWSLFGDLQFHHISYDIDGFEENPGVQIHTRYNFVNPKAGISYADRGWRAYLSYAQAAKEPNRDDFEAGLTQQPKPEHLGDIELGLSRQQKKAGWSATFYYMHYKDQLVLTGKINDVGAYTRTNIPNSYRLGVELEGNYQPFSWLSAKGNLSLSQNKVLHFSEYLDDYDDNTQKLNQYASTDIAFSPTLVAGATIDVHPAKNIALTLLNKMVSRQYLDNTQNKDRSLHGFFVEDFRASYDWHPRWVKEISFVLQVNNIWNRKYEPNGYTYSYISGGATTTENYYFPMAGTNLMGAVNISL